MSRPGRFVPASALLALLLGATPALRAQVPCPVEFAEGAEPAKLDLSFGIDKVYFVRGQPHPDPIPAGATPWEHESGFVALQFSLDAPLEAPYQARLYLEYLEATDDGVIYRGCDAFDIPDASLRPDSAAVAYYGKPNLSIWESMPGSRQPLGLVPAGEYSYQAELVILRDGQPVRDLNQANNRSSHAVAFREEVVATAEQVEGFPGEEATLGVRLRNVGNRPTGPLSLVWSTGMEDPVIEAGVASLDGTLAGEEGSTAALGDRVYADLAGPPGEAYTSEPEGRVVSHVFPEAGTDVSLFVRNLADEDVAMLGSSLPAGTTTGVDYALGAAHLIAQTEHGPFFLVGSARNVGGARLPGPANPGDPPVVMQVELELDDVEATIDVVNDTIDDLGPGEIDRNAFAFALTFPQEEADLLPARLTGRVRLVGPGLAHDAESANDVLEFDVPLGEDVADPSAPTGTAPIDRGWVFGWSIPPRVVGDKGSGVLFAGVRNKGRHTAEGSFRLAEDFLADVSSQGATSADADQEHSYRLWPGWPSWAARSTWKIPHAMFGTTQPVTVRGTSRDLVEDPGESGAFEFQFEVPLRPAGRVDVAVEARIGGELPPGDIVGMPESGTRTFSLVVKNKGQLRVPDSLDAPVVFRVPGFFDESFQLGGLLPGARVTRSVDVNLSCDLWRQALQTQNADHLVFEARVEGIPDQDQVALTNDAYTYQLYPPAVPTCDLTDLTGAEDEDEDEDEGPEVTPVDPAALDVREDAGEWVVTSGGGDLYRFASEAEARRAREVLEHYGADQRVDLGAGEPPVQYLLVGGVLPEGEVPGEACEAIPEGEPVLEEGEGFRVRVGETELYAFGPEEEEAARSTLARLLELRPTRRCQVGDATPMRYLRR